MASSFKSPILQAIDQNGNPVPGAKLFVYQTGTTTPVAIYSNSGLSVALPNPLIANARGYFANSLGAVANIFWDGQPLRLLLTNADDSTIWQIDNYISGPWASLRGTAAAPAFTFTLDPNTGMFSGGVDQVSLSAGGVEGLRVTSTQVLSAFLGTAAAPSIAFSADSNTGVFSRTANEFNITAGGSEIQRNSSAGVDIRTGDLLRGGTKVVGAQGAAIADATGGTEITTINAILNRLRAHGLIAT